jgi:hypothetical protein
MANIYPPPPTFVPPIGEDRVSGKPYFEPAWLQWFLDLARLLTNAGGTAGLQPAIQFADEGLLEGTPGGISTVDFVGAAVTAVAGSGTLTVTITSFGHVIEDEGVPLPQRADLNFVGAGVTVTDSGGKTVVTIPGGGGGGGGGFDEILAVEVLL